jgi:hypothetical protein
MGPFLRAGTVAILSAFLLFLQPSFGAESQIPVSGVIKNVNPIKNSIHFLKTEYGARGPIQIEDVLFADANTAITVDGRPARLGALRPDFKVTITYEGGIALEVIAVSPEEEQRSARETGAVEREAQRIYAECRASYRRRIAQEQMARRAALEQAYREHLARWQEAQLQAYREQAAAWQAARNRPGGTNAARTQATLKITSANAAYSRTLPRRTGPADDLLDRLLSEGSRLLRDKFIESALKDAFPRLVGSHVRAARRAISLYLDGELTLENFVEETAKEEILNQLKKLDPDLGGAAEVADFIWRVLSGGKSR